LSGLYYLVFGVYAPFTHAWHSAVPVSGTGQLLRNVYDGVLGGTLVVFNHFRQAEYEAGSL